MWELDHKEGWALKNRCFQTVVLEKTLESPLGSKKIKPVHPKWNQSWILIGRTVAEAEVPILWPPDAKSRLIGKDTDVGNIEGRRRRGQQRMRWLDVFTDSMDMSLSKLGDSEAEGSPNSRTQLSNWVTTAWLGRLLTNVTFSPWNCS